MSKFTASPCHPSWHKSDYKVGSLELEASHVMLSMSCDGLRPTSRTVLHSQARWSAGGDPPLAHCLL